MDNRNILYTDLESIYVEKFITYSTVTFYFIFVLQKGDKAWTDQQWACVILFGFTLFALCVAVVMQQVMHYAAVGAL